ncbi:hypothetical protein EDD15DRAFT_565050 [Pisolithus albus]|nr:hypothetical protein EDD15DRAFT_565050 [Pisolithus albus]
MSPSLRRRPHSSRQVAQLIARIARCTSPTIQRVVCSWEIRSMPFHVSWVFRDLLHITKPLAILNTYSVARFTGYVHRRDPHRVRRAEGAGHHRGPTILHSSRALNQYGSERVALAIVHIFSRFLSMGRFLDSSISYVAPESFVTCRIVDTRCSGNHHPTGTKMDQNPHGSTIKAKNFFLGGHREPSCRQPGICSSVELNTSFIVYSKARTPRRQHCRL